MGFRCSGRWLWLLLVGACGWLGLATIGLLPEITECRYRVWHIFGEDASGPPTGHPRERSAYFFFSVMSSLNRSLFLRHQASASPGRLLKVWPVRVLRPPEMAE